MSGDKGTTLDFALSPCGQGPSQPAGGKGGRKSHLFQAVREMEENAMPSDCLCIMFAYNVRHTHTHTLQNLFISL